MAGAVRVKGLKEFQRACNKSSKDVKLGLKKRLVEAGEVVATEARARFSSVDARSAGGFRPRVRGPGTVVVEQKFRRTTGFHPSYGSMQMRTALVPALEAKSSEVERNINRMLDDLVDGF